MLDHTLDAKNDRKWYPKSLKIDFKIVKNRLQKGAEGKNRKSVKTSNAPSFLVHFCYPRGSKIQQNSLKSGVENEIKIKCDFEVDFSQIWVDFGAIQHRPKIEQKRYEKTKRF